MKRCALLLLVLCQLGDLDNNDCYCLLLLACLLTLTLRLDRGPHQGARLRLLRGRIGKAQRLRCLKPF